MRFVIFVHSLLSDWNNGNAHFLRGIVTELAERGHDVRVHEPRDAWSVENLVRDHGEHALYAAMRAYPRVHPRRYDLQTIDLEQALEGADVVIVHDWTDPMLVARIGTHRRSRARKYKLFFYDTHHRSVTGPAMMSRCELSAYDGVLAFGRALQDVYVRGGWARRAFVWHEAADTRMFHPRASRTDEGDVVWIGNWGDEERSRELAEFFLGPARDLGLAAQAYGVRYPMRAREDLDAHGVAYGGYMPNFLAPEAFARFKMTVHVARRAFASALPGIPTIRVFETLACGIPLATSPWDDCEGLFSPGTDFLVARDGAEMATKMRMLTSDQSARRALAARGLATIRSRHTCAHRADELFGFLRALESPGGVKVPRHVDDERSAGAAHLDVGLERGGLDVVEE